MVRSLVGRMGVALVLAGCAQARHATPAAPVADTWSAATWEQRHETMTFLVLPNMARAFQGFEHRAAPDLTCSSCHGPDGEKARYAMPATLPALDPEHLPTGTPMGRFMAEQVTPSAREMLGKPDLSCFTCHRQQGRP